MLTTMTEAYHTDKMKNEETRGNFKKMKDENCWVDTDESAKKMLEIVKDNKFTSGDQIDFYDR